MVDVDGVVGMSDGAGLVKVDCAGSGAVLVSQPPVSRAATETAMDVPEITKDTHRGAGLWGGSLMRMPRLYQGCAMGCK